jgi:hypothetical protein
MHGHDGLARMGWPRRETQRANAAAASTATAGQETPLTGTAARRRPALLAACTLAAIAGLSLAACSSSASGGTSSGNAAPAAASAGPATPGAAHGSGAPAGSSSPGGAGRLTAPGAHLGFGQAATVAWVPPSADATSAQKGFKLQVTVESIEKGTIADFRNVELSASERHTTPYYVTLRIKALGSVGPHGSDDPAITFDAIDDRGQQQQSITFLGTFTRCNETSVPKRFVAGKTYQSCLAYLMPGGGSIRQVQWGDGPHTADQVTPYFDHPIVWGAG